VGRASTRLLIAALAVALGFGGYWVGRGLVSTGQENFRGAAEITVTTTAREAAAATERRHRRNLEVLGGLLAGGAAFVVIPAIVAIPSRRRRRRGSGPDASRA